MGQKLGFKHSEKTRIKMSLSAIGKHCREKSNFWKGGITPLNTQIRESTEYRNWRKKVYKRDNYTCIWCGRKRNLNADHIKPFSMYPKLRFSVDNGRTLCLDCHKKTDTFAGNIHKLLKKSNIKIKT